MSVRSLAEVYEKLKELRRQGELPQQPNGGGSSGSAGNLLLDDLIKQGFPRGAEQASSEPGRLIRALEIRTLADRIFGDENEAEAWLNRKNPSFSGQKPVDLLRDELGAALVREALEQIDQGIFA